MALPLFSSEEMTQLKCGKCGITFNVPEYWRAEKQRTGDSWFCPNGHCRVYSESDAEKYRKLLEQEKQRHLKTLSRLNEAEAAEQKITKELSRVKKRVHAGVCPCCNRTFQQLARHMKNKHPEQVGRIFK
jgi:NMD protein affecting ribosome stability and mRNA decay